MISCIRDIYHPMRWHMSDETDIFDDDEIDGCGCEFTEEDATLDEDLPTAEGGIDE
jgi:hypothetical protein